jgi:hypothetical protein
MKLLRPVLSVVSGAALVYVCYRVLSPPPPEPVTAESTCANPTPCPNNCLKRADPGWTKMKVAGHPDTDVWMTYTAPSGKSESFNQTHAGHVIALVNGRYVDTGTCSVCNGTTVICH